jgi:hypothetical protein
MLRIAMPTTRAQRDAVSSTAPDASSPTLGASASRGTGGLVLCVLVAYVVASAAFYFDGFFRFLVPGVRILVFPAGVGVLLGDGRFSLVSWARVPILIGTAYALGACAAALWRGRPAARLLCFSVFFGLLLPQAGLFVIYLTTVRGVPLSTSAPVAIAVLGVPTLALGRPRMLRRFDAHEAGLGWTSLRFGARRLLLTVVALGWLGFVAEVYVGLTVTQVVWPCFVAANLAMLLACGSAVALLRLRVWGLFGAVTTAVLVAAATSSLVWNVPPGWGLEAVPPAFCAIGSLVPIAVVVGLTWPFWRSIGARLRYD